MTTITLNNEIMKKILEKWQKEHPLEKNSKTQVVERICIEYLKNKNEE